MFYSLASPGSGYWQLWFALFRQGCSVLFLVVFFFFSSRRRHTRYWRDWSSDVCSSDLSIMDMIAITFCERAFYGRALHPSGTFLLAAATRLTRRISVSHRFLLLWVSW